MKLGEAKLWLLVNQEKSLEERQSEEGKQEILIYNQTKKFLKPFLEKIKQNDAPKAILNIFFEIAIFCMDGDYLRAHEKYFELAIGNAPWPIGVAMAGIHERSYSTRNHCTQEPHIYKEEKVRRYLMAVKRIITFLEKHKLKL